MTTLSPEYFENKVEQGRIKEAVRQAIPENVYYHNLIIVFSEMLVEFTCTAFKEEVFSKSTDKGGANEQ